MALCESLQRIYDKPLLLKNHQKPLQVSVSFGDDSSTSLSPLPSPSFSPSSSSLSSPFSSSSSFSSFPIDFDYPKVRTRHVSTRSDSLSICSANLGLESCDDVETPAKNDFTKQVIPRRKMVRHTRHKSNEFLYDSKHTLNTFISGNEPRISRITGDKMPPPISTIARNGKPWVCLKSFRNDGRFVLNEVRIPTQELLQSRREEGRLKLHYVQSDEETVDE